MTKISQLSSIGDSLAIGDQFLIRDIDDTGSPNKSVTVSGITRALDLGTAAAPAIAFATDKNTGIFSPGADQLAVATNGTEKLIVKSDGKVGIGTSTPVEGLVVGGATANIGIYNTTAGTTASPSYSRLNFYGYLQDATGNIASISVGNSAANQYGGILQFATNQYGGTHTTALTIDNQQHVGIGSTTPNRKLEVSDASVDNFIRVHTTGSTKSGIEFSNGGAVYSQLYFNNVAPYDLSLLQQYTTGSLILGTNNTEHARITSAGLVGIGTTSPSSGLHLANQTAGSAATFTISNLANNWSIRTGTTDNALVFVENQFASEKARIDSSGRFLVGTSTARVNIFDNVPVFQIESAGQTFASITANLNNTSGAVLLLSKSRGGAVGGTTIVNSGDEIGQITFSASDGSALRPAAKITGEVDGTPGANDMPGRLVFSTTEDGAATPTERMRITSGGSVLFNATAVVDQGLVLISYNGGANQGAIFADASATSGNQAIRFKVSGSTVGSISTTASATAYNTSSDYRLKENVTAVTDGITRLQQLKPSRFNFIVDPDHTVDGFIAHEVQDTVPEAITGEKDAEDDGGNPVYQGIDQSKLVPLLTAALQEAIGEIESLKARVVALESA